MRTQVVAKFVLMAALAISTVVAAACSGVNGEEQSAPTMQPREGRIYPTWVAANVNGGATSISRQAVDSAGMAHFKIPMSAGQPDLTFMAYAMDGALQVRADVCPPCRSISFSLDGDRLVCNSCGTVFKANSGVGVSGPCRNYPKASVTYQMNGDSIVMRMSDLQTSYDDTIIPG